MFAITLAIGEERVREVVGVLAAELRIRRVDRRIAFGTVAVDAGLAGRGVLRRRELLARFGVAGGQAGRRGLRRFMRFAAFTFGHGRGFLARAGGEREREHGDGERGLLDRHGVAHFVVLAVDR
jgi:hypothetical protein